MAINPIHGGGKAVDHRLIHLALVGLPSLRERLGRDPKPKHHRKIQKMLLTEQGLPWEERTATKVLWAGAKVDLARFRPGELGWQEVADILQHNVRLAEGAPQEEETRKKEWITDAAWELIQVRRPLVKQRLSLERRPGITSA